jgi:hypothetical protein
VLRDGTIAFVRGRDYRVEYLHPDGTWTSSQKLPFEWQHMTEEAKQALVDSVKKANERQLIGGYVTSMIRWVNTYNKQYPANFKVPDGFTPQAGFLRDWKLPEGIKLPPNYIYGCSPGEEPKMTPPPGAASDKAGVVPEKPGVPSPMPVPMSMSGMMGMPGAPGGAGGTPSCIPQPISIAGNVPPMPTMREVLVIPPNELPDYRPPFAGNSVRSDADGNLWVRTIPPKPIPGGNVYDLINEKGELFDRLQIPPGYTIVGFGQGRVVYLSMRDPKGIHLARVRLK